MKKLKNITPISFQCGVGLCPAVYTSEDGDELFIVGKKVQNLTKLGIEHKVGADEQVISVKKEMLRQIF